eukprot:3041346-Rhodomonas_salina.1
MALYVCAGNVLHCCGKSKCPALLRHFRHIALSSLHAILEVRDCRAQHRHGSSLGAPGAVIQLHDTLQCSLQVGDRLRRGTMLPAASTHCRQCAELLSATAESVSLMAC